RPTSSPPNEKPKKSSATFVLRNGTEVANSPSEEKTLPGTGESGTSHDDAQTDPNRCRSCSTVPVQRRAGAGGYRTSSRRWSRRPPGAVPTGGAQERRAGCGTGGRDDTQQGWLAIRAHRVDVVRRQPYEWPVAAQVLQHQGGPDPGSGEGRRWPSAHESAWQPA